MKLDDRKATYLRNEWKDNSIHRFEGLESSEIVESNITEHLENISISSVWNTSIKPLKTKGGMLHFTDEKNIAEKYFFIPKETEYFGFDFSKNLYEIAHTTKNKLIHEALLAQKYKKQDPNVEQEFLKHSEKWKSDTLFESSSDKIVMHKSYQRIIGLGKNVLPFIFRDLQETSSHWFWALEAITGENPVPEKYYGQFDSVLNAWLNWGSEQGYL